SDLYYFRRCRFNKAVAEYYKVNLEYMFRLGHRSFLRSKLAEVLIARRELRAAADIVSALRAEDPNDTDIIVLHAKLLLADGDITEHQLDMLIGDLRSALKRAHE